ncbi:hypothetical protein BX611_0610 [Lutibacter oceani]|uniref:Lipoprotein n=1 Tax=Lutibacter oceani TaxID=1853311 RepID=A0A3D9RZM0_9FLAO|nr:hypothetical protein [Lutibacter oceani]REE83321.1 hypothetical protein BX611_0610 [Lutibacter oceani]
MKLISLNKVFLFLLILSVFSCQSDYTKLVKKELASGKQYDSIFHNLKFGQTKSDFFKICWGLNEEGIATHGPSNNYVQTILKSQDTTNSTEDIRMLFYAKFNPENIITAMDVKFSFVAWAPWNDDLLADKLLPKVKDTLMKWYPGNPFIKVKNNILVKVDGNRQIQLAQESDRDVSVLIEDLAYKYNNINK